MSYILFLLFGGRGRVRTGRRGKTVKFELCIYVYIIWRKGPSKNRQEGEDGEICIMYICIYYLEEGAEREPVGGGRR